MKQQYINNLLIKEPIEVNTNSNGDSKNTVNQIDVNEENLDIKEFKEKIKTWNDILALIDYENKKTTKFQMVGVHHPYILIPLLVVLIIGLSFGLLKIIILVLSMQNPIAAIFMMTIWGMFVYSFINAFQIDFLIRKDNHFLIQYCKTIINFFEPTEAYVKTNNHWVDFNNQLHVLEKFISKEMSLYSGYFLKDIPYYECSSFDIINNQIKSHNQILSENLFKHKSLAQLKHLKNIIQYYKELTKNGLPFERKIEIIEKQYPFKHADVDIAEIKRRLCHCYQTKSIAKSVLNYLEVIDLNEINSNPIESTELKHKILIITKELHLIEPMLQNNPNLKFNHELFETFSNLNDLSEKIIEYRKEIENDINQKIMSKLNIE